MNQTELRQRLLETMEAELAAVGCVVSSARRKEMASVLRRIDRVRTREESEVLCAELERELREREGEPVESSASQPIGFTGTQVTCGN